MALALYFHPLASFCHKVLIALYENETPFTGKIVKVTIDTKPSNLSETDKKTVEAAEEIAATIED